jgi:phosphate:Na+ symporter
LSQVIEGIISLVGALGLFLYAIFRLGDGVQKMVGEKIRIIIEKQAQRPLLSLFSGMVMSGALQSNLLTFGMISSLVNAGLLGLFPALWIMLGGNLGMTVTTQLLSYNARLLPFVLLFLGYLMNTYGKRRNWHYLGQVLFNLALLYLSFSIFHQSFQLLTMNLYMTAVLRQFLVNPWLGFLIGVGIAALFRSSN